VNNFDSIASLSNISGFMMVCIPNFIIALIVAAIMKKKKPEFAA
jgi:Mg2+ and Co2+ transporter CorA